MFDDLNAICGPKCDQCPAYVATHANDRRELERIAAEWTQGSGAPSRPTTSSATAAV